MDAITAITVLPYSLFLCRIKKDDRINNAYYMIKALFFPDSAQFISYTESPEEISIVCSEEIMHTFPPTIEVSSQSWRAIQVSLGSMGYTSTGIVRSLSEPLGKAKISIFYLSTFNTEYILVEDQQLAAAIHCLKQNFNILLSDIDNDSSVQHIKPPSDPTLPLATSPMTAQPPSLALSTIPSVLCLASMSKDQIRNCTQDLLKLILFSDPARPFFSFTETEDEISLLLDAKDLAVFPPDTLVVAGQYQAFKRLGKLGFGETGVVAKLSAPLAQQDIPLLYVSTFLTSYILVQQSHYDEAVACLRKSNVSVAD